MKLFIKKVDGLVLPTQGHPSEDAGQDIIATSEPNIVGRAASHGRWHSIDYIEYKTNLFWTPDINERDWHIELFPRSSISKYWQSVCNSVATIDRGYQNEVLVRMNYLWQPSDLSYAINSGEITGSVNEEKIYKKGEKIIQMKPRENIQIEIEVVDELPPSSRGMNNFGSTGR